MFNLTLPDTALCITFRCLAKADLKSARLVSKRWHRLLDPSRLYDSFTVSADRTALANFEAVSLHPAYSAMVTEAAIELDSSYYTIREEPPMEAQHPNLTRLVQCVERVRKLKTLKLTITQEWSEFADDDEPSVCYRAEDAAFRVLQALHEPTGVSVEHVHHLDNECRLTEVFRDLHWPTIRSLTLSGFSIPNHEVFLAILSPYKPTLRALHIRNFIIRDYGDVWAVGTWEPFMKGLRDGYAVEEFSMGNLFANDDFGHEPWCGRERERERESL